jgi:hypothetical protein
MLNYFSKVDMVLEKYEFLVQFTSYNFQCTLPKFEDWNFEDLEIVELHMRKP